MRKYLLFTLLSLFGLGISLNVLAQNPYKIAAGNANKVKLYAIEGDIEIEGHNGSEIEISAPSFQRPEKAEGLSMITSQGTDNTGIGMNVQEVDGIIVVSGLSRKRAEEAYVIKVPNKLALAIELNSNRRDEISIKNFNSEVEASLKYDDLIVENVTGPLVLKCTYGEINISFGQVNQDKPSSIISSYGDLNVSLPANTPANLKMESSYGDIYTDFEIAYGDNTIKNYSDVIGKINGGGVEIYLKSPYKNIYLRKQK